MSRERLIGRARSSGCRLVAIVAPAGYGKSTMLGQWAALEDRAVAALALSRFDDDPGGLIAALASAYVEVPGVDPDLVADVSGAGVSVLGRAATRLASALRAGPCPFVLLVDDLHELRQPGCQDVLSIMSDAIPAGSQLVVASRTTPTMLPRLRVLRLAMEIGARDLALGQTEAREIFSAHDVRLDAEQVARLVEDVEGWPVGITLAAIIARQGGGDVPTISGTNPIVSDYLYQEALEPLAVERRAFLRRTAVLEELSGPLCDAVLGVADSEGTLQELERSRLFIVPADQQRRAYRYHALFRDFLLAELQRVEPELVPYLHERAADWFEAHGALAQAIEHLLHTDDRHRCAQLIATVALADYQTGKVSTLRRWLAELGDEAMIHYPPIAVLAGDLAVLTGNTAEAERWLSIVGGLSWDGAMLDGTASFESSRAMMCPSGPEQMLADASICLDQEPPDSGWRDGALDMVAQALWLLGDREEAVVRLEETAALASANGGTDNLVVAEADLAVLALERGTVEVAAEHSERSLAAIERHRLQDYGVSALAFASGARVALARGDLASTRALWNRGMRARQFCTLALPYFAVRARLHLVRVSMAMSDTSAARHLLREIGDILHERPRLGTLIEEVAAVREEVSVKSLQTIGRAPLSPAELRVLPYLQTHLTLPEIAERLFVSKNTVRTQVASIYRKLDATSRAEAVRAAVDIGLLGG